MRSFSLNAAAVRPGVTKFIDPGLAGAFGEGHNLRAMRDRLPSDPPPDPGTIEFELTDLWEARAAHDALPAGVDEFGRMQPGYWEKHRRTTLPTDRALTGRSLQWLMQLPAEVRPEALRDQYPRIVNGISEVWPDMDRTLSMFERLLNDKRPGRKGFPAAVHRELELLCELRAGLTDAQASVDAPPAAAPTAEPENPALDLEDTRPQDFSDTRPMR